MTTTCLQCSASFEITGEDLGFYEKVSPVFNGKKCLIPVPTLCPDCRTQRRMSWRNEKTLYSRKCDLCRKEIISIYRPQTPFPVYCQDCFWSDKWDAGAFQQPYNLEESFFSQLEQLLQKVPRLAIINKQAQNSDYCNYSFANKNCYLTFGDHYEEDCMYGRYSTKNKNCLDYLWLYGSELSYECLFSKNCYNCVYLKRSEDCQDCYFSIDLKGCKNCLFSSGLRQKQYHIFNQPYSKEDYFEKLKEYDFSSFKNFQKAKKIFLEELPRKFPVRALYQVNCQNCTGDNQENCKNTRDCFDCSKCEDIAYAAQIDETYTSMDMTCMGYDRSELCYQTIGCSGTFHCLSCDSCWHDHDLLYCNLCFSSQNCFGCISLQRKQYCILNKQYSKEEYEELAPKIIEHMIQRGEWGEFFPASVSPFGYNETVAQEYFTLTREQVMETQKSPLPPLVRGAKGGFNWSDYEAPAPVVAKVVTQEQMKKLPDNIKDIPDDILNWALTCEVTGKPYKIIKQELKFYREHNLPVPRRHPDQRHKDRMALRNPRKLWNRTCMKCNKAIQTTYAPDRPEIVYCEECYLKEVY